MAAELRGGQLLLPEDAPRLEVSQRFLVKPQHFLLVSKISRGHFRRPLSPSHRQARRILGISGEGNISYFRNILNLRKMFMSFSSFGKDLMTVNDYKNKRNWLSGLESSIRRKK